MRSLVTDTRQLLATHRPFLLALSRELHQRGSLEAKDVAAVATQFNLKAEIREEGYLHLPEYREKMDK